MNSQTVATGLSLLLATAFATLYFANQNEEEKHTVRIQDATASEVNQAKHSTPLKSTTANTTPEIYTESYNLVSNMVNATRVSSKQTLAGIPSFSVRVVLEGEAEKLLDKESIQNKFELALRRSGIPVDETSDHKVAITLRTFQASTEVYPFLFQTDYYQEVLILRSPKFIKANSMLWNSFTYGAASKSNFKDIANESTVEMAEILSNEYLSQNPKANNHLP